MISPATIIIETPKNSPVKFDYDEQLKCFKLNKLLPAGMVFPFDFGYIPGTKGADGDPLDIISISEFTSFTGCAMDCNIIGVIKAEQTEKDGTTVRNDRFIGIPVESAAFETIRELNELPAYLLTQLQDFFINYNEAAGKIFKVLEIAGSQEAHKLLKIPKKKK